MKIISLHQPWATLVVIGAKRIVTWAWNTKYRGLLGIHACASMTRIQRELCQQSPFAEALSDVPELRLGAVIGAVELKDTFPSEKADAWIWDIHDNPGASRAEKAFGDYSPNRYGWLLEKPRQFRTCARLPGARGFWHYQICRNCGCTEEDCSGCIARTGQPCYWVEEDLCSLCAIEELAAV